LSPETDTKAQQGAASLIEECEKQNERSRKLEARIQELLKEHRGVSQK
jgi:hypothetical protein